MLAAVFARPRDPMGQHDQGCALAPQPWGHLARPFEAKSPLAIVRLELRRLHRRLTGSHSQRRLSKPWSGEKVDQRCGKGEAAHALDARDALPLVWYRGDQTR